MLVDSSGILQVMQATAESLRSAQVRRGQTLEYLTIGWNSLEAVIAVGAGLVAGSIALVGFGLDSVIEVSSGVALLWRLSLDADVESRERTVALWTRELPEAGHSLRCTSR